MRLYFSFCRNNERFWVLVSLYLTNETSNPKPQPCKIKLLLGILHLSETTIFDNFDNLDSIIDKGLSDDSDEWIRSTASLIKFFITKQVDFSANLVLKEISDKTIKDLELTKVCGGFGF